MKAFIIEDEIMAQKSLTRALEQNFPDIEVVGTATSVKGAVAWLKEPSNRPDIIFMYVELADGIYFEIFRQIDVDALVRTLEGTAPQKSYKERYIVRFNDRIIPLMTSSIAYIFSEDKNNYLVTFDGQKYIIDSSLDVIAEALDPEYFFRISRGCIVSMKAIDTIIKQMGGRLRLMVHPAPSFDMTVSRLRVNDFLKWLER